MKSMQTKLFLVACVAMLTACNNERPIAEQIGLKRSAPDEFMVLSRPALTVPPEFRLPEPGSEALARIQPAASTEARSLLIGSEGSEVNEAVDSAENVLLSKAKAHEADPNIREALRPIEQEQQDEAKKRERFFGGILAKLRREESSVIDADAEAERLREEKAKAMQASSPDEE